MLEELSDDALLRVIRAAYIQKEALVSALEKMERMHAEIEGAERTLKNRRKLESNDGDLQASNSEHHPRRRSFSSGSDDIFEDVLAGDGFSDESSSDDEHQYDSDESL